MNKYIKNLPININTSLSQPVYFFSNQNIDNNIYLCQQCNSIQNALFIIDVWNKYGYNIGTLDSYKFISDTDTKINSNINIDELVNKLKNNNSFDLSKQEYNKSDYNYYIYISDDDIREKFIGKGDDSYKIIIYKKDNILHYIALLYYKKNILEKTDYNNYKNFEESKIDVSEEKQIYDFEEKKKTNENLEKLKELTYHIEKSKICEITGLKNRGNSCYQDSVLLALLGIPNDFINKSIINKDIDDISNDPKREIKCSDNIKNDRIRRNRIKKELNKIMNSIRNPEVSNKVENCSMLREHLSKCPSTSGQEFHSSRMQDAGEFLIYLFSLFNVTGTKRYIKTIVTNDIENDINFLENSKIVSERIETVSPIISIHSKSLRNTNIDYYLDFIEDTEFDKFNLYKDKDGNTYKRKITYDSIEDSNYLIFYAQRLLQGDKRSYKKIIPNEEIILKSKKKLYLHAIVVHERLHYTCYIKCNNVWFHYNDIYNNIEHVGTYDEMIENSNFPDPCKMGNLYFYSLLE